MSIEIESEDEIISSLNSSKLSLTESNLKNSTNLDDINLEENNKDSSKVISIVYHGIDIIEAARKGNLPVFLLLWGKALLYKQNLLLKNDEFGNTLLHHASVADNIEVLGFLYQQTKGMNTIDNLPFLESKNCDGMTPLLCACKAAKFGNIKSLIESGADVFVHDYKNSHVFIILAKKKEFICMQYIFSFIEMTYGHDKAIELIKKCDNQGHSALDWASDSGCVNTIEYLIRIGIDPLYRDSSSRQALYWAVRNNQIKATLFLLNYGCDCNFNFDGDDPLGTLFKNKEISNPEIVHIIKNYAMKNKVNAIINYFKFFSFCKETREIPTSIPNPSMSVNEDTYNNNNGIVDDELLYSNCYRSDTIAKDNKEYQIKKSNAIQNEINFKKKNEKKRVCVISFVTFCLYASLCVVPSWFFVICILIFVVAYTAFINNTMWYKTFSSRLDNAWKQFTTFPERHLGGCLGLLCTLLFFLSISYSCKDRDGLHIYIYRIGFIRIGAMSGSTFDPNLFYFCYIGLIAAILYTFVMVWFVTDPGIVDTRYDDFDEILHDSIINNGKITHSKYCKTTLVIKPLRSKYCTYTGAVIARMDHFCVFLNTCIGFKNHRLFIGYLFLVVILSLNTSILFIRTILRDHYYYLDNQILVDKNGTIKWDFYILPALLLISVFFVFIFCTSVLFQQIYCICNNLTFNEKLNYKRYSYLFDDDGTLATFFDRGVIYNILEFLGVNGYSVDYFTLFTLFSREMPPQTCFSFLNNKNQPNDDLQVDNKDSNQFKLSKLPHSESNSSIDAGERRSSERRSSGGSTKSSSLNSVHFRRFSSQSSIDQDYL